MEAEMARGKAAKVPEATMDDPAGEVVHSIKGFDQKLRCRDFQFEVGKTYTHDGSVRICESGFHAIEGYPLAVFDFYPPGASRYGDVDQSGQLGRQGDKTVSAVLTVKAELTIPDLVTRAIAWIVSRLDPAKTEHATGHGSASSATRYRSASSATGLGSASSATGDQSASSATGHRSASSATGYRSASSATGYQSASSATGYRSASSATGDQSASSATGDQSASSATGYRSASSATGDRSASSATGDQSASSATGYQSASSATGDRSASSAFGPHGTATASG